MLERHVPCCKDELQVLQCDTAIPENVKTEGASVFLANQQRELTEQLLDFVVVPAPAAVVVVPDYRFYIFAALPLAHSASQLNWLYDHALQYLFAGPLTKKKTEKLIKHFF